MDRAGRLAERRQQDRSMKILLTREFDRLALKLGLEQSQLRDAVHRANSGLIDAELGAHLIKQRVARTGAGRSGGYRTIIFHKRGNRSVFLHVFEKSNKANLTRSFRFIATSQGSFPSLMTRHSGHLLQHKVGKRSTMTKANVAYRSDALRSLHLAAEDLHAVGALDKATLRRFDVACLTPVEVLPPEAIKHIREVANMSQATFALALNVSTSLISKWERGEKKPSGPSLKLLTLADKKGIDAIL